MTFYQTREFKLQPLREDGKIETMPFLNAVENFTIPFFQLLGSTAFAPVTSDIKGNITKLTKKYELDKVKYNTLQDIVETEIEEETQFAKNSATDALMWLQRALEFIRVFLRDMRYREDLVNSSKKAYEDSLKRYHGWMVQGIFSLAMKAVPYKKDFIRVLGQGADEETVIAETNEFLKLFDENLDAIIAMYKNKDIDVQKKV